MGKTVLGVVLFLVYLTYGECKSVVNAPNAMWASCPDVKTTGKVVGVKVNGKSDVCTLVKGTTANFTLIFEAGEASKTMKAVVHGEVFGQDVPFPLKDPDVCNNHGVACPVAASKTYTYTNSIDILKIYPTMGVVVKWENTGDDGKDVLCVLIDCNLQ